MPQRAKASPADHLFAALANPTRREVLDLLLDGPQTVQSIAGRFDMSRPSLSEHLKVLRDAGLVVEERVGRYRRYSVDPAPLHEVRAWLDPYERYWRARLADLGEVLDDTTKDEA
jgi:DNA-binding transcriptional ArsR family regulator